MCMYTASNASVRGNTTTPVAMQIAAEEGRLKKAFSEDVNTSLESLDFKSESSSHPTINYPVGKPLEVKNFSYFHIIFIWLLKFTPSVNNQSNQ